VLVGSALVAATVALTALTIHRRRHRRARHHHHHGTLSTTTTTKLSTGVPFTMEILGRVPHLLPQVAEMVIINRLICFRLSTRLID
jgi:hypothetical protein